MEIQVPVQASVSLRVDHLDPEDRCAGLERGLRLPLVYNTGGYDSLEALALLDGVVDIYMPDMNYGDDTAAHKYSHVRDYVRINQAAVREMVHPSLSATMPTRMTSAATARCAWNGSPSSVTPISAANTTEVSRKAATAAIGAWVIAQITTA